MFDFAEIKEVELEAGGHANPAQGLCFMEMVAWFAGESHTDRPACACPTLGKFGIALNDTLSDPLRNRLLKPLVPLMAGTSDRMNEEARAKFIYKETEKAILERTPKNIADTVMMHLLSSGGHLAAARANLKAYSRSNYPFSAGMYLSKAVAECAYALLKFIPGEEAAEVAVQILKDAILLGRHEGLTKTEEELEVRREELKELVGAK